LCAHSEHESADGGCSSRITCSTAKKVAPGDIIFSHEDGCEFNFFAVVGDVLTLGVQALEVGKNLAGLLHITICNEPTRGLGKSGNSSKENEGEDEDELMNWNASGNLHEMGPPTNENPYVTQFDMENSALFKIISMTTRFPLQLAAEASDCQESQTHLFFSLVPFWCLDLSSCYFNLSRG